MNRYVAGVLVALAAPAAGAVFAVSPAAAGATTVTPAAALRCHASMSNSRPKDYTTIYVNVGTVRYAGVTTVAHYKTVSRKHTGKANAKGNAKIGYYISGATPGYRVNVSVTVTSGRSRGACSTSFIPHR
jgi:competence protein ComEC